MALKPQLLAWVGRSDRLPTPPGQESARRSAGSVQCGRRRSHRASRTALADTLIRRLPDEGCCKRRTLRRSAACRWRRRRSTSTSRAAMALRAIDEAVPANARVTKPFPRSTPTALCLRPLRSCLPRDMPRHRRRVPHPSSNERSNPSLAIWRGAPRSGNGLPNGICGVVGAGATSRTVGVGTGTPVISAYVSGSIHSGARTMRRKKLASHTN